MSTDARYGMRSLVGDALEVLRAAPQRGAGAVAHHVSATRAVLAVEEEVFGQRAYAAGQD